MKKGAVFIMSLVMALVFGATVHAQRVILEDKKKPVVHPYSRGTIQSFPDKCKTPSSPSPIPIPYPNIGMSSDTSKGSKKVKTDGKPIQLKDKSHFSTSDSDEPGYEGKGSPTIKPDATLNQPRPTYYKYLEPTDGPKILRRDNN